MVAAGTRGNDSGDAGQEKSGWWQRNDSGDAGRSKIKELTGHPRAAQRLIFHGQELDNAVRYTTLHD